MDIILHNARMNTPPKLIFSIKSNVAFVVVTLCLFNIAMEHGPIIDGLPIKNGDFSMAMLNHQMVSNLHPKSSGNGTPTEVAGLAFGASCDFERVDGSTLSAEARI